MYKAKYIFSSPIWLESEELAKKFDKVWQVWQVDQFASCINHVH